MTTSVTIWQSAPELPICADLLFLTVSNTKALTNIPYVVFVKLVCKTHTMQKGGAMRKPNRERLSVTVTLKKEVLDMLNVYCEKHGSRSVGLERKIIRHEFMISMADLSKISKSDFRLLCQAATIHGLDSDHDPARNLKYVVYFDMQQNRDVKEDILSKPLGYFEDDSDETRSEYIERLDEEFAALEHLSAVLRDLGTVELYALLEAVEEVLAAKERDPEEVCAAVYASKVNVSKPLAS
ncbi:hypothetical protein [Jiella sp. M17.18]|uniref:hypothetical protein n=1 Tax=Jiella sp. M17.18 TaxID=3234247 RepID=UPI0034DE9167